MRSLWHSLDALAPGQITAVPAVWRRLAGEHYEPMVNAFLRPRDEPASAVPCPHECGCAHEVIIHEEGDIVGVCRCESWNCDNLVLQPEDIMVLELNWSRLGRAIARAFDCEPKEIDLKVRSTRQIATFGASGLPIVLTMQAERHHFRQVITELMARLRRPFILLAPTCRHVDVLSLELLANAQAGFCPLDDTLTLLPSGSLYSPQSAGELFSQYLPAEPETMKPTEAQRIFGLLQKLRGQRSGEKAPLHEVFAAVVLDGLTQRATAERCGCSLGQISTRVGELESRFGLPIQQLRAYASPILEMDRTVKGDQTWKHTPVSATMADDGDNAETGDETDDWGSD
ncbi:hypothetical protein GC207_14940 [bacterium]|nr:hypothetical protein [bacterium]